LDQRVDVRSRVGRVRYATSQPPCRGAEALQTRPVPSAQIALAGDEGYGPDLEKDEVAEGVGIDGGAVSAEEAAMHIVEP
jgi:hypothetical protein